MYSCRIYVVYQPSEVLFPKLLFLSGGSLFTRRRALYLLISQSLRKLDLRCSQKYRRNSHLISIIP